MKTDPSTEYSSSAVLTHLYLSVVGTADNPLVVEPDTANKFFVAFKNSEAGAKLYVPQPTTIQLFISLLNA